MDSKSNTLALSLIQDGTESGTKLFTRPDAIMFAPNALRLFNQIGYQTTPERIRLARDDNRIK
jgi:hypothetical protein